MGVFKKLFKGIKKVFKKIARGIKKAFKAFGKFMGKIGFVGQMAMMFLFPGGIGNLLTKGLGKLGAKLAAVGGVNPTGLAKAVQGVGNVLTKTQQFVTKARAGFGSITDGIKEFGKTALNKIPGINIEGAAQNFFGTDSAFSRAREGFQESVGGLREAFDKGTMEITEKTSLKDLSNRLGITQNDLKRINPTLENFLDKDGFINPREGGFSLNVDLASGVPTPSTISAAESQRNVQAAIASDDPASFITTGGQPTKTIDIGTTEGQAAAFENISKVYPDIAPRSIDIGTAQGQAEAYKNLQQTYTSLTDTPLEVLDKQTKPVLDIGTKAGQDQAFENIKKVYPSIDNLSQKGIAANADANRNWFQKEFVDKEGFFRTGLRKTGDQFNPEKVGFLTSASNIQGAIAQFSSPEEIDYGTRGGGLQDYHSGMPPFMPNQYASDTTPAMTNNMFGAPSLTEMMQLYGVYSPDVARV